MAHPAPAKPTPSALANWYSLLLNGLTTAVVFIVGVSAAVTYNYGVEGFKPPRIIETLLMLVIVGGMAGGVGLVLGFLVTGCYRLIYGPPLHERWLVPVISVMVLVGLIALAWFFIGIQMAKI